MTLFELVLFLHVVGFILWIGVAFATMFIAVRARRSGDSAVTAFGYRTSSWLLKTVGLAGMLLTIVAGYILVPLGGYRFFEPFPHHWLFQMQVLGTLAFLVAALYQVPLSDRLARAAEASASAGEESQAFRRYRRRSAVVGSILGVILLLVVFLGTVRPGFQP